MKNTAKSRAFCTAAMIAACTTSLYLAQTPLLAAKADQPSARNVSEQSKPPTIAEIIASAPPTAWQDIRADDLLVMTLAPDSSGAPREVLIRLMHPSLTTRHRKNIEILARTAFWDGTSINRVQDNYVVQWGDAGYDNPENINDTKEGTKTALAAAPKALPDGLMTILEAEYQTVEEAFNTSRAALEKIRPLASSLRNDAYAPYVDFEDGWPLASDLKGHFWPVHCYAMVGVGRNYSPDTGSGAELYTVIGQAPRHLDRNIALVGQVISGMAHLTSLKRGTGELGFYKTAAERTEILSIRIASDLPEAQRPDYAYLRSDSGAFAQYVEARANRQDPFFIHPAGGVDICNVPVPIRNNAKD